MIRIPVMPELSWRFHLAVLTALSVVSAPVVVLLFDRVVPYVVKSGVIIPDDPIKGQNVRVVLDGLRFRYCPGTVYREVEDSHGEIHRFAPVPVKAGDGVEDPDGVPETLDRMVRLPFNLAPGPAIYRSHTYWHCNLAQWVWPIYSTTPDLPFTVRPSAPPAAGPTGPAGAVGPTGPKGDAGENSVMPK